MRRGLLLSIILTFIMGSGLWEFGPKLILRFGGLIWIPISNETFWIPKSIAMALSDHPPDATAGTFAWRQFEAGFEIGELPVIAEGTEVDRILLARIDPSRFKFAVRNDPTGRSHLDDWAAQSGALLVVNGGFFTSAGTPATPVVIDGKQRGPTNYSANQGAFSASASHAGIYDLANQDWQKIFTGADAALVSYPLLIPPNGAKDRIAQGSDWLANRSFIGEDKDGWIIIGTTKGAFFSLRRLADFLKRSPLNLEAALNLDGGPVACQEVQLNGFQRKTYGRWEIRAQNGQAKVLPPWPIGTPPMPNVLMVFPRRDHCITINHLIQYDY